MSRAVVDTSRRKRPLALLICAAVTCLLAGALLTSSAAAATSPKHHGHHHGHRIGGKVHRAWPARGKAPRSKLARWLARQVGPTKVKPCRRRIKGKLVRCHRGRDRHRKPVIPHHPSRPVMTASSESLRSLATAASTATGSTALQLTRSYAIPTDDPSYTRLLNWSWTYDSALTAMAFSAVGDPSEAQQLLDQLAALQHTDGSIEIAFNVATGQAANLFRSGVIATVGIAGSLYDQQFNSTRYLAMDQRVAAYLLSLQGTAGLIRGGPDVSWYSTEHNLLAYAFFRSLGNELKADGSASSANTYYAAASAISAGIQSRLIVHGSSGAYFTEGLNDTTQALDADAYGAMYLQDMGNSADAQKVLAYAQSAFAVTGQSIVKSSDPGTYNQTYSAPGPFAGYEPYLGANAPNVLWTEGTAEMLVAAGDLGQSTLTATVSLLSLAAVTPAQAPLTANRTVTSIPYGVEYHVWPGAAAGAWSMIALQRPTFTLFR